MFVENALGFVVPKIWRPWQAVAPPVYVFLFFSGFLNMDPDGPYRTHLLFPGRRDEDPQVVDGRGNSMSPSSMKSMFGGGWGRKGAGLPFGVGGPGANARADARGTPEADSYAYMRGGNSKQVRFQTCHS